MEKFEHNIVRGMTTLISDVKDCTPILYDHAVRQQQIIEACKSAARAVFHFKDVFKANSVPPNIDVNKLSEIVSEIESEANNLVDVALKQTELAFLEPQQANAIQESASHVMGDLSLFRIFLGKLRISSGLRVMNKLSEGNSLEDIASGKSSAAYHASINNNMNYDHHQHSAAPNYSAPPAQGYGYSNYSQNNVNVDSLNIPMIIERFNASLSTVIDMLKSPMAPQQPPNDILLVREQMKHTPQWLIDKLAQEHQMRIEMHQNAISLKSRLDLEKANNEYAKERTNTAFKLVLEEKEREWKAKYEELQKQSPPPVVDKSKELAEKEILIEELKGQLSEIEAKYQNTKESLAKYMIEVEEWKKETNEKFSRYLSDKDLEIQELRETIELAMRKDVPKEEVELVDQLLDFIDKTSSKKEDTATTLKSSSSDTTAVVQNDNNNNTATAVTSLKSSSNNNEVNSGKEESKSESNATSATDTSLRSSGNSSGSSEKTSPKAARPAISRADSKRLSFWKPAKKFFKIHMPYNQPIMSVEYKDSITLGTVLESLIAALPSDPSAPVSKVNIHEFHFQHVDAPEGSPPLKLSGKLGSLNATAVRLVKNPVGGLAKSSSSGPVAQPAAAPVPSVLPNGEGVGTPYNVFHTAHKTVEDLIRMMEKTVDENEKEEEEIKDGLVSPCPGFDIELGNRKRPKIEDTSIKRLVDSDKNTPYYSHYFKNKSHINYWAEAGNRMGPVLISMEVLQKEQREVFHDQSVKLRALVRTKFDDEWVFIPSTVKSKKKALVKAIETDCRHGEKLAGLKLRKIGAVGPTELGIMEEKLLTKGYKFGVLYVKEGQTDENGMFANTETSSDYEEFLNFLGERIDLQGWSSYRGGLDVKSNSTGTKSIFTKHLGFSVMFHVSTLLPFYPNDQQQLERKRHLGNDVCVIIFKDSPEPFAPDTIKSEFNHVFAVVTKDKTKTDKTYYKVSFAYKGGIGMAEPLLPYPAVFEGNQIFRDFLLTKLINSERFAMYAPNFVNKIAKTKELQMQAVIDIFKNSEQKQ